jgi:hypothetical protein
LCHLVMICLQPKRRGLSKFAVSRADDLYFP